MIRNIYNRMTSKTTSKTTSKNENTPVKIGSLLGRVKWFRNGKGYGYGFITCVSENDVSSGQDIYVYQQNIHPNVSTFRTLVKDEYVSFDLSNEERPQAVNVTGVNGGPLRCDTPRHNRRNQRDNENASETHSENASETHSKNASETHSKNASETHSENASETHSKNASETH